MASGTINYESSYANMKMRLQWSSTTTVSTFKTTVSYTLQASQTESSSTYYATYSGSIKFLDASSRDTLVTLATKSVATSTIQVGSSWVTVASGSFTVSHNSSGSGITIWLDNSIKDSHNITYNPPADGAISIPAITTKATITSAPNFTDTDNPTVYYSNPIGSNATALDIGIYDTSGYTTYAAYRSVSKTGSSYTFNLTDTERATLIAAAGSNTTLSVRFYLRTKIGSTSYLSYSTKTMTIDASGPTITASISDVKAATKALTGGGTKFIRGNNSMQFSMSATGQKGATISSYSVVCGNMKSSSASGTFTNIENDVVIFSATDSRGKTSTKTVQLSAIDYVKLTCNQTATMIMESESSAQVHLNITGNFFNGSFGAKSNTLKLYVRHARNGEALGDWVDLSALLYETDGNTYSLSPDVSGLDPSGSYVFQCKAVDALSEATSGQYTVKFMPVFDWSKYDFNFNVPISIEGNPLEDYVIDTGTEAMGTNGTWYWSKWKSGKAECYGCRNYGNMAVTTAWGGLYRSESFSQSLPYGLFIDTPEVIDVTYRVSNYGGWIAQHEGTAPSSSNSGGFIVVRPASATLNQAHIGFHVIGRWKE